MNTNNTNNHGVIQANLPQEVRWDSDETKTPSPPAGGQWSSEDNTRAKIQEESATKTLLLRKKELRWKLMQASQAKNRAKLEEIRTETNYHKQKLSKAKDLAAKLRSKYLKVVKSAKIVEAQFEKAEAQLLIQEKFVADEKMQLTKLALDCLNLGNELYGNNYQLPNNSNIHSKIFQGVEQHGKEAEANSSGSYKPSSYDNDANTKSIMEKLSPFLRTARSNANLMSKSQNQKTYSNRPTGSPIKKRKKTYVNRLSSLYDLRDSVLRNLASYRLTSKFAETGLPLTDLTYSHNVSPHEYICLPDLVGDCTDKNCPYQHKSNYMMTDLEKLTDILSYKPSLAGFKPDPDLNEEENYKICRITLKQKAAKLISRNSDKSVETIAQNLVRKIRINESDQKLLTMTRELPKVIHLVKRESVEAPKLE